MSIVACTSCSWRSLTPMIITKTKINVTFWECDIEKDEELIIEQRNPPYIDLNLFRQYITNVVISYIVETGKKLNKPKSAF